MKCALICFFSLLLAACHSSAEKRLERYIHQVLSRTAALPKPIPHMERLSQFDYSEDEKLPDPFQPKWGRLALPHQVENAKTVEQESLKFVGVVKKGREIWALISRSDGRLFPIQVGDFLKGNGGKVIRITDKTLQLEKQTITLGQVGTGF
jgi:Tfp pilus assembly protein PilP